MFSDDEVCFEYAVALRWQGEVRCPFCGSDKHTFMESRKTWQCKNKECKKQFSVKKGTIFEDSPIKLDKWFAAMWLIANAKNGISSCELSRALGITQKSAWFMLHRIREAMENGTVERLYGRVEADETFIGGRAEFKHADKRKEARSQPRFGKTIVFGMLERGGKIEAKVVEKPDRATLGRHILNHVDGSAKLYTDAHSGYEYMSFYYQHQVINHAYEYVRNNVHTNGIENFWSLLKRGLKGTYVSVEPVHLRRYVTEQVFRYNTRKGDDASRFEKVLSQISGRRLTYSQLIGREYLPA